MSLTRDVNANTVDAMDAPPTFSWVFAASLALHAAIGARLVTQHHAPVRHLMASQVEVEIAPPPPSPPVEPPPTAPPPLPEPAAAPPPQAAPPPPPLARAPLPAPAPTAALAAPSGASDDGVVAAPAAAAGPPTEGSTTGVPGGTGTVAAPLAPPSPATPAPIVPAREGANYRNNPRPPYPRRALKEGWEGKVVLRVKVLRDGRVGGATVQSSAGHSLLDEAAVAAVQSWTFSPAKQGDVSVEGWVTVPIDFHIQ